MSLLPAADLAWLARLRFVTQRAQRGGTWGERRSVRRGQGLEFADYRDYSPGDDPRRVDWNLLARLDRPYVRLFEEEQDLSVTVLLDTSPSMAWGEGESARWPCAQRLALALAAIALLGGDPLRCVCLGGAPARVWGPYRGRGYLPALERWIATQQPTPGEPFGTALETFARQPFRPGLALLITDGYDPAGLEAGWRALAARGHETVLLHLLTPEELDPTLRGELELEDSETGLRRPLTLDQVTLRTYHRQREAWQAGLRALAARQRGRYVLLETAQPLRRMLLDQLRHAHVVK